MQWARRIVSTILAGAITFTVVAPAAAITARLGWLDKIQLIPAALILSVPSLVIIALITVIFGRLYCSTVCPMGWIIDAAAKLPRLTPGLAARNRYRFSAPKNRFRLIAFLIIVGSVFTGSLVIFKLFAPYSAFCNMVEGIAGPLTRTIQVSAIAAITAWLTLFVVVVLSAWRGRALCNTICPVGTLLATFARKPLFHFDINTDLCTNCRQCVDRCKSRCIDLDDHVVDMTRCVVCFDCTASCPDEAIKYTINRHQLKLPMLTPADTTLSACSGSSTNNPSDEINSPQSK